MAELLAGKTAIVTGGGRGIGRGIALCLARDGADVAVCDRDAEPAHETAREIEALGRRSVAIQADVSSRDGAERMVAEALAAFGHIDVLVNNAGVMGAAGWNERAEPTDDDWAAALRVNLMSRVYCSEAVVAHMKERGGGKIVTVASNGGFMGSRGAAHYSASKAADISYTKSLAVELGRYNINVNAICPGITEGTDMARGIQNQFRIRVPGAATMDDEEMFQRAASRLPLRRGNTPEDLGWMASFLASDRARNVHGQAIAVDGGATMR